jgi:hypothetical protein
MRLFLIRLILSLSICAISTSNLLATENYCSKAEAIAAKTEADTLRSWQTIYNSYKKYHQCDDGAIAAGYSDSIIKVLANNWKSIQDLNGLVKIDKDFLKFILKHIDGTVTSCDVQKVYDNANQHCPKDSSTLCSLIKIKTEDWLREFKKEEDAFRFIIKLNFISPIVIFVVIVGLFYLLRHQFNLKTSFSDCMNSCFKWGVRAAAASFGVFFLWMVLYSFITGNSVNQAPVALIFIIGTIFAIGFFIGFIVWCKSNLRNKDTETKSEN